MKIEKAIELNKDSEKSLRHGKFHVYADAVALGNEALKATIRARQGDPPLDGELLPGETED